MLSLKQRLAEKQILEKAIDEAVYQYARQHRGCMPGIVSAIDTAGGNYTITPAITEPVLDSNGVRQDIAIGDIPMVKLAVFGANGFNITFPVDVGDEGLLLFQDMCLDAAWQNGGSGNPQLDKRRHDLSDAIFIPLKWTQPSQLSSYSGDSLQIRSDDGETLIDLIDGQITIMAGTKVQVLSPAISMGASGGTPKFLMNADLETWITGTLIPALTAHSITVTPPPATVVTTVLKGQ